MFSSSSKELDEHLESILPQERLKFASMNYGTKSSI
jgi:hypothetical protein